jgi:O-antigen/teichoic acid export membrane protein
MALLGGPLVANILNAIFYFGVQARDITPSIRFASRRNTVEIVHLGFLFLVLQIVAAVAYTSDTVIVAQMLGADKVAEYVVPSQMFSLVSMAVSIAVAPLWPAYGEALARGDYAWVRRTLKRSLFLTVCLTTVASSLLVLVAPHLLTLWVGHAIDPPFALLLGLGIWKVLEAGGNATSVFLNGANVVRLQVVLAGLMGLAVVTLKIMLIKKIGIVAVPWATILAYLVFAVLPLSIVVPRIIQRRDPVAVNAAGGMQSGYRAS